MSDGKVAVATRLLGRIGSQEYLDAEPACPWDERVPPPDRDATLLAVVPIPGTGTSLAIVGYAIATTGSVPDAMSGISIAPPKRDQAAGTEGTEGTEDAGLLLDNVQRRVWAGGCEIPLTFQEFELLAFLSAHPATVFSRADLVRHAWHQDLDSRTAHRESGTAHRDSRAAHRDARAVRRDSRTVDVHISRIRHKLGPLYGQCLVTEYRAGYQFRPPES